MKTTAMKNTCPILDLLRDKNCLIGGILFGGKSIRGRAGAIATLQRHEQAELIVQQVVRIETIQAACFSLQQGSADTSTKAETIAILYRLACGGDPEGVLPSGSVSCPGLCTRACTDFELHEASTQCITVPLSEGPCSNTQKTKRNGTPLRSPRNCEEGFSGLPYSLYKHIPLQSRDKLALPPSRKTPSSKPKSS